MSELSFVIVEFIKESTLAVVPLNWLNGPKHCFWPPYSESKQIENSSRRGDIPGSNWISYPVKQWLRSSKICWCIPQKNDKMYIAIFI